jgi:hypothetical protein
MSTPIQQGELSPNDPRFYAPLKWRSGEINVPSVHPLLNAPVLLSSQASAEGTYASWAVSRSKSAEVSDAKEYIRVRTTALASAVGVLVWIAFCVATGLARIDASSPAYGLASTNGLDMSLNERLQAANTALDKVSRPALPPTLVVADASGVVNAAIPLAVKVSNYTPNTTVNLSGLAAGTTLSSGARAEEGQWRVAIDDLPHTRVIPPPEYVGAMTIVAELRGGDDRPIVRTPVRLVWNPLDTDFTAAVSPEGPPTAAVENPALSDVDNSLAKPVLFGESPASQNDSTITQPRPHKTRRHMSNAARASLAKAHRHKSASTKELQTDVDSRLELRSSLTDNLFANADAAREQRFLWFHDGQTNGDPDGNGAKECQTRVEKRGVEKRVQRACR